MWYILIAFIVASVSFLVLEMRRALNNASIKFEKLE